jgi:hypothetical protein
MKGYAVRMAAVLAAVLLASCGGDGDDGEDPDDGGNPGGEQERPGMADSLAAPVGTAWNLPAGLELDDPIKGHNAAFPENCKREDEKDPPPPRGSGDLIQVCMGFNNTTDQTIPLRMPPGLILVSDSAEVQNGILVTSVEVQVPARQQLFVPVRLYCLNASRSANGLFDTFRKGPVTEYSNFKELFTLLATKQVPVEDGTNNLQEVVWNLSRGVELSASDRATINKLPNK